MSFVASSAPEHQNEKTAGNLMAGVKNPYLQSSEWGWKIDPVGLQTVWGHHLVSASTAELKKRS